jgi:hypothetical protein
MLKTTPAGRLLDTDEGMKLTTSRHYRSIPNHPPHTLLLILHPRSSRNSYNSVNIRRSRHGLRGNRYPRLGRMEG